MITLYDKDFALEWDGDQLISVGYTELCILPDAITCTVKEELNGIYELQMTYPATGTNATWILVNRIIGIKVPLRTNYGENVFRIYRVEHTLHGIITVYASQISSDLSYVSVATDRTLRNVTSFSQFIEYAKSGYQFTVPFFFRDEAGAGSAEMRFATLTSLRAYLGGGGLMDPDQTALQIFDGEYIWEKNTVTLATARGTVRDIALRYGMNIAGFGMSDDIEGLYSHVQLVWDGDAEMPNVGVQNARIKSVYAPVIQSLGVNRRVKVVDYSGELVYETPPTYSMVLNSLNSRVFKYAAQMSRNAIREIDVDVAEQGITEIFLGDTLNVNYTRFGISVNETMKVVAYEYDCLLRRYTNVTLGTKRQTLAKAIADSMNGETVSNIQSTLSAVSGLANVGNTYMDSASGSLASNTYGNRGQLTLPAGTYVLLWVVQYAANATGQRWANWNTVSETWNGNAIYARGQNALASGDTYVEGNAIITLTAQTTIYNVAWQNSGSALATSGILRAVRIK